MKIRIVSGTDRVPLQSEVNHRHYATRHGYDYKFDTKHYANLPSPHFRKLYSVQYALDGAEWVFWLDDDAFFTDMSLKLERFLNELTATTFLVICNSPVNPQGGWTFLNSGVFFMKNDARARDFLFKVVATPVATAKAWWNTGKYGMFTNGDQDSLVFTLIKEDLLQYAKILPYDAFNNRPYHYKNRIDEHFVVHFPGVPDKKVAVASFGARFGLGEALVDNRSAALVSTASTEKRAECPPE